jgi:hypothetical protein
LHSYDEDKEKEENDDRKIKSQCNSKRVSLYYSSSRSKGVEQAIEFYKKAFGAKELNRAYMPGVT